MPAVKAKCPSIKVHPKKVSDREALNQNRMIKAIAEDCGCSQVLAKQMLESLRKSMLDAAKKGQRINLSGIFSVNYVKRTKRCTRKGRNPATGKSLTYTLGTAPRPTIRIGKALKEAAGNSRNMVKKPANRKRSPSRKSRSTRY